MSLRKYSHEEIADLSMIETAYLILKEEKKATDFREVFNRLSDAKGLSASQKSTMLAQFYTDLNTDGRFMTIGSNLWGLKQWYPFEQIDEEVSNTPTKKKKSKKKKAAVADEYDEDFDDEVVDELDLELIDEDFDELDDDDDDDDDVDEDIADDDVDPSKNLDDSRVKDDAYDGDFRRSNLDKEDREVVEEDTTYTGDDDDTKNNDDNYK